MTYNQLAFLIAAIILGAWLLDWDRNQYIMALGFEPLEFKEAINGMEDIIRHNDVFEDPESKETKQTMRCWNCYIQKMANYKQKDFYLRLYNAHKNNNDEVMSDLEGEAQKIGIPKLTLMAFKHCNFDILNN